MRYRRLGRTGLEVSAVSLGGAYLMGPDPDKATENTAEVLRCAAALGINYIDTAPLYGASEALLGPALARVKADFHVSTKVGFVPQDFDYSRDQVLASLERSLERLGVKQLAIAQIHEVNLAGWDRIMQKGGTLEGLRTAQKRGLCRWIGITGRAIPLLARLAATDEFDALLCYHDYHPCCRLAADEVLPAAAASDMGVIAATVLAGGLYVDAPKALAEIDDAASREAAQKTIAALERQPGTLPQQAFRWVLGDRRVSSVSSGAANPAQLQEVAQAAAMEPLAPEALP